MTVQYYIADRVRWVSKLTVLDSGMPWTFKNTLSAWNLLTQGGPSAVGRKTARREARRWESIVGGAGLGRLGRTHSALLVGVQALSGGFRTLHCLSVVTESWIQTFGSQTPSKSLSRTQNSYPLKNPKVSQTEHTPTNGESVERQKLSREWGRVVGFSWMLSKTSKYARMPSSTQ